MAAEVEVQTGQVGSAVVGGRPFLTPLTDSSNSLIDIPPINQSHTIAPELNKPAPCPKPRLTPKPFAVERNTTIKPIVAPKPQAKPRPVSTDLAGYKPEFPCSTKPQQPVATGKPRPVSANLSQPASTSFKTSNTLATRPTTRPVIQPFKPAPSLDLGDPSRPTPTSPAERQKPSHLAYSKSLKNPPAAEWSGTTNKDEKDLLIFSKGGASMTRAKSLGFLVEVGKEDEEKQKPEAAVPLRLQPRASRPRPVSAIFLDSPTKTETPVPAPRWAARRPLSTDLTSKFESIGLSLHRKAPKINAKENTPQEKALSEKTPKGTDGEANPAASDQSNQNTEVVPVAEADEDKNAVSIKSRINLLLDSSSSPGATQDLLSPVEPVPETEPPVGVKQLIKQLTVDTTPTQGPAVKPPLRPRPLPLDLTKMFSSERLPDLGSVSLSDDRHDIISKDPQRGMEESALGDQRTCVDSQELPKKASTPEGPEAGQTLGTASKDSGPSGDLQTVRASLFENVVERHSVLMVDEAKPVKKAKDALSSPSFKSGNVEDEGTLVTAIYKDPVSPSSPLRVVHAFDTVQAVEESRAVSETVPSAQREDKAMTLRTRRSEGSRPAAERTGSAVVPQPQPRYLRVGALQKWTNTGLEQKKGMLTQREEPEVLVKDRDREAEQEEVAAAPKRLKMLHAEEQPKPKATYFALTGQLQEPFSPVDTGASVADLDDFSVKSALGSSQGKILPVRRSPSFGEAFGKTSQDQVEGMRSHKSHREISSALDGQTTEEAMEVEKKRELKKEMERHKAKMRELEREKQRQLELEREALLEFERMKEMEMQREFERQRQKAFEKEKREFEEQQRALERQKQTELEKQKAQELERLERERQRQQRDLERQRKAERERQERERQREQERQRQREEERQRELDKERQLLEIQKEKQKMEELQRIKELETQQLIEFQKQKQFQERKERDEAEKIKQMALEQEMSRLREIEKERERQREMEREKQKELERQRQRELDRERQRQLDIERQELENQRLRQRELEKERRRKEEMERFKEMERRQLLEIEKQKQAEKDRILELEKQRLREKMEREEAERMRQIAKQQQQRLKDRQKEEEERSRLEASPLRPQVVDIDSVFRIDPSPKSSSQRSDPATRWKEPSVRPEESYKPAILDIDSFTSQAQHPISKDLFPVSGIQGLDTGFGARLQPERDISWKVPHQTSLAISSPVWTTSPQDPWELLPVADQPVAQSRKQTNKASPEQLLLKQKEQLPAPQRHWSALLDDPFLLAPFPGTEAKSSPGGVSTGAAVEPMWFSREPQDSGGDAVSRRSQGSQVLNRMRSRSVSRRSAPSGVAVEAGLSRLRSRSAHREQDRHSSVQQKQSNSGEEEERGGSGETPPHETDSQYGTWETGLRTDDSLTPATPSSESNLSPSPRKPTPPHTPGDPSSLLDTDTVDSVPPPLPSSETQTPSFPEAPAALLDTSALRSRAQLMKKRAPRTRPTRATRQSAAASEGAAAADWLYRDSTEPKAESKDEEEEQSRGGDSRGGDSSSTVASQPQRIALFPGMDPSALKAQLKKRSEAENPTDGPAPSPSQISRSPKSPFLPRAARVLPPPGGKETSEEDSPQWLKELKSKKRLSQFEMES